MLKTMNLQWVCLWNQPKLFSEFLFIFYYLKNYLLLLFFLMMNCEKKHEKSFFLFLCYLDFIIFYFMMFIFESKGTCYFIIVIFKNSFFSILILIINCNYKSAIKREIRYLFFSIKLKFWQFFSILPPLRRMRDFIFSLEFDCIALELLFYFFNLVIDLFFVIYFVMNIKGVIIVFYFNYYFEYFDLMRS